MYKRTLIAAFIGLFLSVAVSKGQTTGNCVVDAIMSSYSARMFTPDPVTDNELDMILKCGIKAPSARNSQLWKFTVVRDTALTHDIIRNIVPGNVVIFVSGQESGQQGPNIDFDCALATENMYVAAQGLGLGAHIYTGPVGNINSTMRQVLGIPEGYRVVSVLRVGHIDKSVDATSSASARKKPEEVINYK